MVILGIDPGLATVGFGLIKVEQTQPKLVDAGVIETKPNQSLSTRLEIIYKDLKNIIEHNKPEVAAVEKDFYGPNVRSGLDVASARGVILLVIKQAKLKFIELSVTEIKSTLTGYGRAPKEQIQGMVRQSLNLNSTPKPDDCADALAAALVASLRLNDSI